MTVLISCLRRFTNPPIRQALSADLFQCSCGALFVRSLAVRVAEIKLMAVALKVRLRDMVIRPDEAALEDAEERLHRVRVCDYARNCALLGVLALRMVNAVVRQEIFAKLAVVVRAIRHKMRILGDLRLKDRLKCLVVNVGDMEGARRTVALNERENLVLVVATATAPLASTARLASFDIAPKRFVGFNDLAATANRSGHFRQLERFADTVRHEPRGLVSHAKHAVQLMAAHALLAGAKQMRGQNPLVKRNFGALENRPNRHGVLLAAVPAEQQSRTVGLSLKAALTIRAAAMRAYRALGPAQAFQMLSGGVFVVEAGGGEIHGYLLDSGVSAPKLRLSST